MASRLGQADLCSRRREADALDHADRLVVRRARRLREPYTLAPTVVQDDVRERAADIDPEAIRHDCSVLTRVGWRYLATRRSQLRAWPSKFSIRGLAGADLADQDARRLVAFLEGDRLQELPDPQTARIARGAPGRKDVVGPDRLVAVRHRRGLAEKEGTVVPHPLEVPARVGGLDLDVLGRVRVGDLERLVIRPDDDHLPEILPGHARDVRGRQILDLNGDLAQCLLGNRL